MGFSYLAPRRIFLAAALAFPAAGCMTVGPDFQKPATPAPAAFAAAQDPGYATATVNPAWWRSLGDPTLTQLVELSIRHNQQLAAAVANAEEARAMRSAAGLADQPRVGVASGARSIHTADRDDGAATTLRGQTRGAFSLGFDSSWELDLFGRGAREEEAADARFLAATAAVDAARVTIAAETARNYVEMRADQRRMATAQSEIDLRRRLVSAIRERRNAGLALEYDLAGAEAELRRAEALIPNYRARIHAAAQRIGVLAGGEAGDVAARMAAGSGVLTAPDVVPVGLPSDLLLRRPDMRAAEQKLRAATAEVGVATADLFPRFSLTGSVGLRAGSFTDLFAMGAGAWNLGPSLTIPLFNRERLHALVAAAGARAQAAAAEYRQTALTALAEVETALVDYAQEQLRRRELQKAVERSRVAFNQARDLYNRGLKDVTTLIVAQRALADNEEALIASEAAAMSKLIGLYKALGGGWEDARVGA